MARKRKNAASKRPTIAFTWSDPPTNPDELFGFRWGELMGSTHRLQIAIDELRDGAAHGELSQAIGKTAYHLENYLARAYELRERAVLLLACATERTVEDVGRLKDPKERTSTNTGDTTMPEPTCINLAERFGDRYRIGWEDNGSTRSATPRSEHAWLRELRCHYGTIAPYGGDLLIATIPKARLIGRRLRNLPFVLHAKGYDETVVRFHVDNVDEVLAIMRPYKRRQLSPEQREAVTARFAALREGAKAPRQSEQIDPKTDATAPARTSGHPGGAASILGR